MKSYASDHKNVDEKPCFLCSEFVLENEKRDTLKESNMLYDFHINRELVRSGIEMPISLIFYPESVAQQNIATFRKLADKFSVSPQRQWVHEQAQNVQLNTLSFSAFQDLLHELFQEGGVTWERVLVLFYFCTDLFIRVLKEKVTKYFFTIYRWSLYYVNGNLSNWVHQKGGWEHILGHSTSCAILIILGFSCIGFLSLYACIKMLK